MKNQLPLPAGTIDPATLSEDDIDFDELLADVSPRGLTFPTIPDDYARLTAESPRGIRWVSSSLFKDSLQQDLAADSRTIRDLLKWYGEWKVPDDSKLRALVDLANEKHPNEKILVFTEYKDTANY
ncbi:hypothetical protein L7Q18_33115, partial [Achromobacter xylosoxidans]|nr:hypothetical protein [Achromobacter xylosoxidans]